ncbi:MAG: helix-turn-helix domain-containing protein [Eubacteriales bacterium]|nr:helix-turn-helix domain-containing protein [Eubacteriales bacterium]
MDQRKIGVFLKTLRKEKNITQEQLAEKMGVSNRSVSRWETGANLPDLDILMQLADYYSVELREILDGERRTQNMDPEMEETVLKVADYSNQEKLRLTRRLHWLFLAAIGALMLAFLVSFWELTGPFFDFLSGMGQGVALGMLIVGALFTSRYGAKIRNFKRRLLGKGELKIDN